MKNSKFARYRKCLESGTIIFALATITGGLIFPIGVFAQDKKDEVSFNLVANPKFANCLRKNSCEEPRARATVIRGNVNDTLILDLDGIKPGLHGSAQPVPV